MARLYLQVTLAPATVTFTQSALRCAYLFLNFAHIHKRMFGMFHLAYSLLDPRNTKRQHERRAFGTELRRLRLERGLSLRGDGESVQGGGQSGSALGATARWPTSWWLTKAGGAVRTSARGS